ncbi:alpha/beta fold hydrolase [candidate division KSB1 bacterium]|nr:alpha/beta fold hydrolase [candidate division KSB1 bacterium]
MFKLFSLWIVLWFYAQPWCNAQTRTGLQADSLISSGNQIKATKFLESVLSETETRLFETSKALANLYRDHKQWEKCMDLWEWGHERGFFYLLHEGLPIFQPFRSFDRFDSLVQKDQSLRRQALESATCKMEWILPDSFDAATEYPVVLILHGGGSTMDRVKGEWQGVLETQELIALFIRSYRHYDWGTFGWRGSDSLAEHQIGRLYDDFCTKVPHRSDQLIVAGISAGGHVALDLILHNVIPATKAWLICPTLKPKDYTEAELEWARSMNIRIYVTLGESDSRLTNQQQMIRQLESTGLSIFKEIQNMGHAYPTDMTGSYSRAIDWLLKKSEDRDER